MRKYSIIIFLFCFISFFEPTYSMHDTLEQRIQELHASLVSLRTKLTALQKGLNSIKNKLAGIEEPNVGELGSEGPVVQDPRIQEAIDAIKQITYQAQLGEDLRLINEKINQEFHKAEANIKALNGIEISDGQRAEAITKLQEIKEKIKNKYQKFLNIGDTKGEIDSYHFQDIVQNIIDKNTSYEQVLNQFLKVDTTSLKNPKGYNSIQVVADYMKKLLEEETVDATQVLKDALGSMKFRTQALVLFYILLQNDFFNDAEFLIIVINSVLGYIGQNGFGHLGKCVTAQLLEKIPNMSPELLTRLKQVILGYDNTIKNLPRKPEPTIAGTVCTDFEYFERTFSSLGIKTKKNLLRYILSLEAEIEILKLQTKIVPIPEPIVPDPLAPEPIVLQPIAPEPEPEINNLIISISDSIEMLPEKIPHGNTGFPVDAFKKIVQEMKKDLKRDLLNIPETKNIRILGYFKLFTKHGHHYFMKHLQLKKTYPEMISLCTLIMKNIFNSTMTFDSLKEKHQNITLLATFANFLFNIKQEDFASIDDPMFNPAHDRLRRDNFQSLDIFKTDIPKYVHQNKNMFANLINWFDDAQQADVQHFFTKTDMPQMGKTVVFQSAFAQLQQALIK